jgi:hypothetical protein
MSPLLYQLSYTARRDSTQYAFPTNRHKSCGLGYRNDLESVYTVDTDSFGAISRLLKNTILLLLLPCWFSIPVPIHSAHDTSASFVL